MNFEELQQAWKAVKTEPKSHDELRRMMYSPPPSHMRSGSWKEILRLCLSLSLVLAISLLFGLFNNWSTIVFVVLAFVEILDEYVGLRFVRLLPQKDSIEETLRAHLSTMKMALLVSRLARAAVWLVVVFIAGSSMQLGFWNTAILGLASLPLIYLVSRWSSRKWALKVAELKSILEELNDETEVTVGT